uniref:F-box domain-containing protein n=1 Tax=Oryza punctata TaxID=4537 RepID=A0A0E0KPJ9_ORYPU
MAVRPRRRRRSALPCAASHSGGGGEGDDRLRALPDELLLIVMRSLDTRSALSAATLSRHWARLPRELPALDFRVSNALLRGYHQRAAEFSSPSEGATTTWPGGSSRHPWRVHHQHSRRRRAPRRRLGGRLGTPNDAHRLINTAVDLWGVEELEVAINSVPWRRRKVWYFFFLQPVGAADVNGRPPLRLTKLTLRNCPLASVLTILVLESDDLPRSTQGFIYARLGLPASEEAAPQDHCRDLALVADARALPSSAAPITELRAPGTSCGRASCRLRHPWRPYTFTSSCKPATATWLVRITLAATIDKPVAAAPGREIIWPPATFRHRKLGVLVVAGFVAAGGAASARGGQVRWTLGVGGGEAAGRWRRAPPLDQNGGDQHPVWKELVQRDVEVVLVYIMTCIFWSETFYVFLGKDCLNSVKHIVAMFFFDHGVVLQMMAALHVRHTNNCNGLV